MGNIILTENQYSRIKNFLVESEITKSFLLEQNITIDNKTGFVTLTKDLKFKVKDEYDREKEIDIVGNNAKLYPTPKGNVGGEVLIKMTNVGFQGPQNYAKNKVYFMCKTSEFMIGKVKYKITDKKLVSDICKSVQIKKNLSTTFGTEAVGGGLGYTQKYDQPITTQDGKKMTIPKGTGFVPKKDGAGASFKLGNDFGWFDCNTKNFVINKVKYTSDTLSKTLSAKLCKSETPAPNVVGGGGGTTPGSKGGGGSSTALPPDIDLYI
jgi:hypothetical protein